METFYALLVLCARNSPATGAFPTQRPVTRRFDVFCDLRLNKRLRKQPGGWWFETSSRSSWRHCNVSARPQDLQCASNGDTAVLHQTIECCYHKSESSYNDLFPMHFTRFGIINIHPSSLFKGNINSQRTIMFAIFHFWSLCTTCHLSV